MISKPLILIIEDEETIIEFLKIGFKYEGYDSIVAYDGNTGFELFLQNRPDIIILDIMLSDIDGFELCRKIRKKDKDVPILMLTAKKEIQDKIRGFETGADDYITKPFSFEELLARVNVWLRRRGKLKLEYIFKAGDIELNLKTRIVTVKGKIVKLTPKEFDLLELFMKNPEIVFSKDTILNRIWGL